MEHTEKKAICTDVNVGDVFEVGGIEFIRFPDKNGKTPAVAKNILFRNRFGRNGNFAESAVLKRLQNEVLPNIIAAVGEENVCSFVADLTTLDGMKAYGFIESKISLPSIDFYRANPEIFDQHKLDTWWWLANADSAAPRNPDWPWVCCVAPSGNIYRGYYFNGGLGVRPFCIFKSSIFGSCEE